MITNREYWWVGQRAIDCIGLHWLLPITLIISCDYGKDHSLLADLTGAALFSLEKETGIRKAWSNYTIEDAVEAYVLSEKTHTSIRSGTNIVIAYRSNTILEQLSQSLRGLTIAAASAEVASRLDDKILCFRELGKWGVTQPKGEVLELHKTNYQTLVSKFGSPFVIKQRTGASGSGTHIVFSENQLSALLPRIGATHVLVQEFVEGPSYNIHAVVRQEELLISAPSVQLVGIPECTNRREVYCGNDFSAVQYVSPDILESIRSETRRIGSWMMAQGYRGLFGVDMIGTDKQVVTLDVNPRFQGSTSLLTQAEMLAGYLPLGLLHVFEFVNSGAYRTQWFTKRKPPPSLFGSQIILHSLDEQTGVIRRSISPGVYTISNQGALQFQRPGVSLFDCRSPGEFAVTCAVPQIGTSIEPGASLLKIVFTESVINLDRGGLNDTARKVVQQVYEHIELE